MKNLILFSLFISLSLGLTNCSQQYVSPIYGSRYINHEIIAVLPFENIYTGRRPKDVSEEDINMLEEAESFAFQVSLHNQLVRKTGYKKRDIKVAFQHYDETNNLLDEAGISLQEAWRMPAIKLADILHVDAIVKVQVHKERYLTDLESYGITIVRTIAFVLSGNLFWFLPSNDTSNVYVNASIIDVKDGTGVWSYSTERSTDWNDQTREVIEGINRSISRRFPYRETMPFHL